MSHDRRSFLVRTGLGLAGALAASRVALRSQPPSPAEGTPRLNTWEAVRDQFNVSRDHIHLAGMLLATHPAPVREAIEMHRRALDENPVAYLRDNEDACEAEVLRAAAEYLKVSPEDIALTDSTTMGLALLYTGLRLRQGQEILTTSHDHYSTHESLRLRAERTGARVRKIALYKRLETVSEAEIVEAITRALTPRTRVLAVTWVHSSTGLKLPIRRIADALAVINARRDEADHALLCVDGVHGLGSENATLDELGCDFFIAGCHKWLFGPRGTGLVWGKPRAWPAATPTIPTFSGPAKGALMTPGGFHSFEHRWALAEAFEFHQRIGKPRVAARIHELSGQFKEALSGMRHVKLYTPVAGNLSAGIVCFDVVGLKPEAVVKRLGEQRIIASVTPYATQYARVAPGLLNTPEEVETTLRAIRALA